MRRVLFSIAMVVLAVSSVASATVVGFGALGACCSQIPDGYGGFHWDSNFYNVNNGYLQTNFGFSYGAPSGGAAFNAFDGREVSLLRDTPFLFNGAYFSTWGADDQYSDMSSRTVTILAYDSQNHLLGTIETALPADRFIFVGADIPNVSKLVFDNDGVTGHRWLMDDLTYDEAAVPEPATITLSVAAVLGLAAHARRRRG